MSEHVRVGVAVLLRNENRVLMGLRKGSHGSGTWSFPGGHLEKGESVTECASRELREETGIDIKPERFRKATFTNDIFVNENKHYVTLYVEAHYTQREWPPVAPEVLEPEKCIEWKWFKDAPSPLFLPITNLLMSGFEIWKKPGAVCMRCAYPADIRHGEHTCTDGFSTTVKKDAPT